MYISRHFDGILQEWLTKNDRKPLVIRGLRQVGKTTSVREFARRASLDLMEINIESHLYLDEIFASNNHQRIFLELQAITKKNITSNTLLFLDEIQTSPAALNSLRYLLEHRPQLPIIATGSLLEFSLNTTKKYSMPVGRVEYAYMFPLRFDEFLLAKGENFLFQILNEVRSIDSISESSHQELWSLMREYFVIGGMPQAIQTYLTSNFNFSAVYKIQDDLITSFIDDFGKYAGLEELMLIRKIFSKIPHNIGKKVKYVNLEKEAKAIKVQNGLALLEKALLITKVKHSDGNGIPLAAESDDSVFKLIFADIGLLNRLLGLDLKNILDLSKEQLINEGPWAEQFVGQELLSSNMNKKELLFYWLREKKQGNAEVNYLIPKGLQIIPTQIKSGKDGSLKSMHLFVALKGSKVGYRLDANPPSVQNVKVNIKTGTDVETVSYKLESYPLYMASRIAR